MNDGIFKRSFPVEDFHLDKEDCYIKGEIVQKLTNFQLDGIRFLWKHFKASKPCILNDGKHMGKTLTTSAFLTSLIRPSCRQRNRAIAIWGCEETLLIWRFVFEMLSNEPSIYSYDFSIDTKRNIFNIKQQNCDIIFILDEAAGHDGSDSPWTWLETDIILDYLVVDGRKSKSPINMLRSIQCKKQVFIESVDLHRDNPTLLRTLLGYYCTSDLKTVGKPQGMLLRRTNEQFLREFPWLDETKFTVTFQKWKEDNCSMNKALSAEPMDTQEMSELLFFDSDEDTETSNNLQLAKDATLQGGSENHQLKISEVLHQHSPFIANSNCDFQKYQNSPDLFASTIDDNVGLDTFIYNSTPTFHNRQVDWFSQSPVRQSPPDIVNRPEIPEALYSQTNDKSAIFEITVNDDFPNILKLTTDHKIVPVTVLEDEGSSCQKISTTKTPNREQLKKSSKSPRRSLLNPTTPTTGWLSKSNPKNRSPEKVIVKKKRKLALWFESNKIISNQAQSINLRWDQAIETEPCLWPSFTKTRRKQLTVISSSDDE